MWKFLSVGIFVIFSQSINAQNESSPLVRFSELKFYSDIEKKYFEDITNNRAHYFEALASIDSTVSITDINSYNSRFDNAIEKFNNSKWYSKKPSKKIKVLYDEVHDTFFDQYSLENNFADVFTSGKYNCVSATGLYALALNKLKIPYVIKEEPTHVYLIAFPNSEKIVIEATNPSAGYTQYSSTFKANFVDMLINTKMIGSKEAKMNSKDELFDKYYFTKKNIALKELVAIQYSNDGLYKMDDQQFEIAFHQLEKSYYLNSNERIGYLMYLSGASLLGKLEIENPQYLTTVLKLARYKDYGVKSEQIIAEYQQLLNFNLFEKGDIEFNTTLFKKFKNAIPDSAYQSTISYVYNYETGRYNHSKGNLSTALDYIEKAYRIKPKDLQVENFFVSIIAQKVSRINDLEKINEMLEQYASNFPSLTDNYNFEQMMISVELELVSLYFYTNKPTSALSLLRKFEGYNLSKSSLNENLISKAYTSGAMHYYRKGYTRKAQNIILQGLVYLPNDFDLTRLQKMMK